MMAAIRRIAAQSDAVRRMARSVRRVGGLDAGAAVEIGLTTERIGGTYGGYVVAVEGLNSPLVYSLGVGEDLSFDEGMIKRFGATVHAFDPTPRAITWLRAQTLPERLVFHPIGVAAVDGTASFEAPRQESHVSFRQTDGLGDQLRVARLRSLMRDHGHDHIDVLKVDIEGSEYDVLSDMLASDIRPSQILVEYHDRLFGRRSPSRTRQSLAELRAAGYRIFYVSSSGDAVSLILEGAGRS
jgi:FkbM family methyltransferase